MFLDDVMGTNVARNASAVPIESTAGDGFYSNTVNIATSVASGLVDENTPALNNGFAQRLVSHSHFTATADATVSTLTSGYGVGWPTTRFG